MSRMVSRNARVALGEVPWARQDLEGDAIRQRILKSWKVGAEEGDGLIGFPEIEQPIAQR
jgi:hypothetical protein